MAASAAWAQPVLRSIQPIAVQRGATTKLQLHGERLTGAYQLICYTANIETAEWHERDEGRGVTVSITPHEQFPRGWHAIRVCTPHGVSDLITIYVSDQQSIAEQEQAHRTEAPQNIPFRSLVAGSLQSRDIDAYAFEVEEGQRISLEVHGLRAGRAMFDPRLTLIDPEGTILARCDDTTITRQDPFLSVVAPTTGRYVAVVTESQYTGNNGFWYLFHVDSFPRPSAVMPPGGRPGATVNLTWLDANGPLFEQAVELSAAPTDEFPIYAEDALGVAPSPIHVRVADLPVVQETEPNNTFREAQAVDIPVAIHGSIQAPGDDDLFRISVAKGQVLDVRVYARWPQRSPLDSVIGIRNADNRHVASNDDANGRPDSYLRFTCPDDGDYLVLIREQRALGQADMTYRMEIAAPEPRLRLTSPELQRNVTPTVAVPLGNRMSLLLNVDRQDVGGAVKIVAQGAPDAMPITAETVPEDRYQIPVMFEADAECELRGHLVDFVGTLATGTGEIEGHLDLRQMLVSGRNNVEMLGMTLDRLATVITEPVPVTLEIVEPQVPLPRSGTMNLQIRALREEGIAAPITVRMLYNPGGVSSQGMATIAADQDVTTLTLTANASAQLGPWPVVVIGESAVGGRQFQVASQMATLNVADRFFAVGFPQGTIKRRGTAEYAVSIEQHQTFTGEGTAELLGLPLGVTAAPVNFGPSHEVLSFETAAAQDARLGRFEGVHCRLTIHEHGEPIIHILGWGSVRVDSNPNE